MATFTRSFTAILGAANSGLVGTLGYTIKSVTGSTLVARTTAGITEPSAGSGIYKVAIASFDCSWSGSIVWDNGTIALAAEDIIPNIANFTTEAKADIATAVFQTADTVETGYTLRQILRLLVSVFAGLATKSGGVVTFKRLGSGTTALVTTTDSDGNRADVTIGTL